jgi:hypothetical protein
MSMLFERHPANSSRHGGVIAPSLIVWRGFTYAARSWLFPFAYEHRRARLSSRKTCRRVGGLSAVMRVPHNLLPPAEAFASSRSTHLFCFLGTRLACQASRLAKSLVIQEVSRRPSGSTLYETESSFTEIPPFCVQKSKLKHQGENQNDWLASCERVFGSRCTTASGLHRDLRTGTQQANWYV